MEEYRQEEVLTHLREMDAYEFEHLVADLWERQGWTTSVTQESNDGGIDIVVKIDSPIPQKHLIQVKRNAKGNNVGGPEIQQYSSLRHQAHDVDAVIVVTTSSFTRQARNLADDLNVKLIDGAGLYEQIKKNSAEDILDKYVDTDLKLGIDKKRGGKQGEPEQKVKRLVESAKKGIWNPDNHSNSSDGGRGWPEKSIETNESCDYCDRGMISWDSNTRIGKCSSCRHKYKFSNGDWLSTKQDNHERQSVDTDLDVLAGLTWNKLLFVLIVVIGTAFTPDIWGVPLISVVIVWTLFAGLVTGAVRFTKWAAQVEYDENGRFIDP